MKIVKRLLIIVPIVLVVLVVAVVLVGATLIDAATHRLLSLIRRFDASGAVIGEIGQTNALGVVIGTSKRELLEMKYVTGTVEVAVGQAVFTTGQDGIFPPGLKIGDIVNVIQGSATTPHLIQIQPSARLSSMQEVGILLYGPPPRTEFEQKLPNVGARK